MKEIKTNAEIILTPLIEKSLSDWQKEFKPTFYRDYLLLKGKMFDYARAFPEIEMVDDKFTKLTNFMYDDVDSDTIELYVNIGINYLRSIHEYLVKMHGEDIVKSEMDKLNEK